MAEFTVFQRGWLGFFTGTMVAAIFSVFAGFVWAINGRSLEALDTTLGMTVLGYFLWGPVTGLVTGLLFPVTRTGGGAFFVGALIMTSGYAVTALLLAADAVTFAGLSILGAIVGGIGGVLVFKRHWKSVSHEGRE